MRIRSRSHDAVIRVYNAADNVIETHEHAGDFVFRDWIKVQWHALMRDDSLSPTLAAPSGFVPNPWS